MPTYVYETLPRPGRPVKQYEIFQSIKDATLTKHPATGEPIRRIITLGAELFVRAATIERPVAPPPKKKSRFQRKHERTDDGPRAHYDHGDDHDH